MATKNQIHIAPMITAHGSMVVDVYLASFQKNEYHIVLPES